MTEGWNLQLQGRVRSLEVALRKLADAADDVGIKFFDTDTMDPLVEAMQTATLEARAALRTTFEVDIAAALGEEAADVAAEGQDKPSPGCTPESPLRPYLNERIEDLSTISSPAFAVAPTPPIGTSKKPRDAITALEAAAKKADEHADSWEWAASHDKDASKSECLMVSAGCRHVAREIRALIPEKQK
jgi:hypothetical protein